MVFSLVPTSWRRLALLIAGAGLLGASSCGRETVQPDPVDTDYYPLAVGSYRIYQVEDRNYLDNRQVGATVISQRRERVTDSYTDAAGMLTYRIIRSVRANAGAAWQDDSVLSVTVKPTAVELTSNNRRTLELVFPAKNGVSWNRNVYNDRDTVVAKNRQYEAVGATYKIGNLTFDNTITTVDPSADTIFYRRSQRQIFARGVGRVYRQTRVFNYCQGVQGQNCQVGTGYIVIGEEHVEKLIEKGP
ncbi:hypothetical protein F0P96_04295 [Hymenobacter busanensis]|uniref:Uncharacterized protein n=1 Tax=Hymenobacter busanensis TaxID=2607656 RepID=A0A7L4ZSU0_9BACT|nr:hypothetical protein [Hymenobacter busanensis]KAA9339843.1 hypothetical protein F0P96_04295 [Hymenobacter busanensis]QHJ06404.1 hypothetical protein GUY19_03450 [Hymenobacter busanensis]